MSRVRCGPVPIHAPTPFGAAIFDYVPPPEEELRTLLDRWIDQFSSDDFAEYISSKGVKAWAVGYDAASHKILGGRHIEPPRGSFPVRFRRGKAPLP